MIYVALVIFTMYKARLSIYIYLHASSQDVMLDIIEQLANDIDSHKKDIKSYNTRLAMMESQIQDARADAQKARAEAEEARADAQKARAEAEEAHADAQKARADAQKARAEAEETHADAQKARAEAEAEEAHANKKIKDAFEQMIGLTKELRAETRSILLGTTIAINARFGQNA